MRMFAGAGINNHSSTPMVNQEMLETVMGGNLENGTFDSEKMIDYLDENLMNWIRRKKMSILTFTVKTSSDLSKAKHLGVDGIIMDDPYLNYSSSD